MDIPIEEVLVDFNGKKEELIPILQKVQNVRGYLSDESLKEIATFINLPESSIFAVATFYAQFRFEPIGKNHICLCRGTACHVKGATRILDEFENQLKIKEGETTEDFEHTLETVACIGACGLAPCLTINKEVFAKVTPEKVSKILKTHK